MLRQEMNPRPTAQWSLRAGPPSTHGMDGSFSVARVKKSPCRRRTRDPHPSLFQDHAALLIVAQVQVCGVGVVSVLVQMDALGRDRPLVQPWWPKLSKNAFPLI